MLKRFSIADALEWVSLNLLDEDVYPAEDFLICFLPAKVIAFIVHLTYNLLSMFKWIKSTAAN